MKIFEIDSKTDKEIINLQKLINSSVLAFGSIGDEVRLLQRALQSIGITPGPIDGKFGRQTKSATVVFQNSVGIEPDGIAGPVTLKKLQDVLDGKKSIKTVTEPSKKDIKIKDLPNAQNAEQIFNNFVAKGFNDIQAAAWVGCITGESANNPNAVGPEFNKKTGERYNSYGLCQWNKGRFTRLQKFAKQKTGSASGWRNNIDLQIDYVMYELENWDSIMGSSAVDPSTAIKPYQNNLEKTLFNLIKHYEKPASTELAFKQRLPYAKSALSNFGSTDIK